MAGELLYSVLQKDETQSREFNKYKSLDSRHRRFDESRLHIRLNRVNKVGLINFL